MRLQTVISNYRKSAERNQQKTTTEKKEAKRINQTHTQNEVILKIHTQTGAKHTQNVTSENINAIEQQPKSHSFNRN